MSTATTSKPDAIQDQSLAFAYELCEALGIAPLKLKELKYLTLALLQVAANEAHQNAAFAEHLQAALATLLTDKESKDAKIRRLVTPAKG